MFRNIFVFILIVSLFPIRGISNPFGNNNVDSSATQTFNGGLRFEKAAGFYWYNGITAEYASQKIWKQNISLGFNFLSSRLGSAIASNAIPFYELDLSAIKYFRRGKSFRPLVRLNAGYAHANYGSDIFNSIPNHSLILSIEAGASYDFHFPIRIAITGGYNVLTGNGSTGLSTIFPVYAQCSVFYCFCNK